MHIEPERHRTPFISLTPLIDVVFILLVFFMLATRFGQFYELPVNVQPADHAPQRDHHWRTLQVEADGQASLDGQRYPLDQLGKVLSRHDKVWVTVAPQATLQQSLLAVDALKALAIKDVQLELLP